MSATEANDKATDFYLILLRDFDYLLNYELAFKIAHMAKAHFDKGASHAE